MNTQIGAYEAKTRLAEILRRVEAGERFTVTHRGVPIAEIAPPSTLTRGNARAAVSRMKDIKKVKGVSGAAVLDLIREGRR